jgi:hypothetical protein
VLDSNNAKALADYKFSEVGVLHYADESADAIEPAQSIHAMWQLVNPGTRVMTARTWEEQPTTGQGWQNHFRVFNMLQDIDDLTQVPADVGKGVIKAIKRAPAPLADSTLDGGVLVVTMDGATTTAHRVIMLPTQVGVVSHVVKTIVDQLAEAPDTAWSTLQDNLKTDKLHEDLIVQFVDGKLDDASVQALQAAQTDFSTKLAQQGNDGQVVGRWGARVQSATLDASIDAAAQHQGILTVLNATPYPGAADHFTVAATDLGSGAGVASLILFAVNAASGSA